MYWFQQASLPGLLANLVAIPVVSIVTVPLILLGLLLLWVPGPLAACLLTVAGWSAHFLVLFLEHLSGLQPDIFSVTREPGLLATILALLGAVLIILPRGIPGRYAGFLLMLPMLLPGNRIPEPGDTQIDFLDVGQGLAVLLTTRDYLLVYDTGPGNGRRGEGGWDMVAGTIQPMIRATGKLPALIVASHADLDHAGGFEKLRTAYPDAQYLASLPVKRAGIHSCDSTRAWNSGNLDFRILHPSTGLPYLGNDSSCVISVRGPGLSLLLSGDISRVVEKRLVESGLEQHAVLTAPHHGSSTSSSQLLIDAVKPELALISAGADNRFGFPRAEVLKRYTAAQVVTLNTALCGGIRITADVTGGFRVESARATRRAIWRWPVDPGCRLDN
jgi:competence protein ComEC